MNRLVVEITERALVGNVELAQPIAADLKQAGVSLALDDFGTGSSSLHHLQALPFDEIKVDASFVRSMEQCRQSRKIVAAVVGLGNSLGLTTVAEGVEEQVQADILVCLGCDYGQGWLFGHAVLPGELDTESLKFYPRDRVSSLSGSAALQLEARPAERRAQLQAIYDGAPVGLCFLDRSLRYVSLNRHLADMHEIPLEGHLGRTVSEVLPHLKHQLEPHLHRALAGEAISNIEVQLPHGDMTRVLLLSYQPARDEVGDVVGISIAALDMTERR
jgi:PAS domain S-box-containing protein